MSEHCDALIIGAGPAGSTATLLLARAGLKVCVLEKATHPRFHIGESILPRNFPLIEELGLADALRALPHQPKFGAEFGFGDNEQTMCFGFSDGLLPGSPTFNIERSHFDHMLLNSARQAGATVHENTAVRQILRLADGEVAVAATDGRRFGGRILLDCSGHSAIVGRHHNTRRTFDQPHLQNVAYFQQFEGVQRLPGAASGHPTVIMCNEGWFWLIGLNSQTTSVGFVARPTFAKAMQVAPDRLLQWAIARCPVARQRMEHAIGPSTNQVLADFSYTCQPFAGPGYLLVGDAACFLDPIFSTGVTLAMMSGKEAAQTTLDILQNRVPAATARRRYCKFVTGSTGVFWRLIRGYYRHSFRELFMNGAGPMQVHKAVISVLAGHVFPRPPWALRWRLRMFECCVWLQRFVPLVPRHRRFSLLESDAAKIEDRLDRKPAAAMDS